MTKPKPATQFPDTLANSAYAQIRHDILNGRFSPNEKLAIHQLRARYDIGASPLREALNRLTSERLVFAIGQRGFRVAAISLDDLRDITRMRILLESEALAESVRAGDDTWEASVVAAFHRLNKIEAARITNFVDWEARNAEFHETLLGACSSPRLLQLRAMMFDQHRRYRSLSSDIFTFSRDVAAEHKSIFDAALQRNASAACEAMSEHIRSTARNLEDHFARLEDVNRSDSSKARRRPNTHR